MKRSFAHQCWRVLIALGAPMPLVLGAQLVGNPPDGRPQLGVGVDTLPNRAWGEPWKGRTAEIYRRWSEFLASPAPRYTVPGATPSPYWSEGEQQRWITFPLALNLSGGRGLATVVDIRPAVPGSDSVYIVKTMFSGPDAKRQPLALVRVYAVREKNRWVFSNALPRTTRTWRRVTRGPFVYIMPGGYPFNGEHAQMAATFADSLARAFAVPALRAVDYYLTESPDEMYRIVGLDWFPASSDPGAFSSGPNRLLVSGNPTIGENYRHEIVHLVLGPIGMRGVHPMLWEGVATWLGGTLGMTADETRRAFATYLREHNGITLDSILHQSYDHGLRPAGAVVVQMAFQRGGSAGVKRLLTAARTDDELRAALERLFGMSWPVLQVEWRRAAIR